MRFVAAAVAVFAALFQVAVAAPVDQQPPVTAGTINLAPPTGSLPPPTGTPPTGAPPTGTPPPMPSQSADPAGQQGPNTANNAP
ncbi:hypothetical protein HDU83_003282, partial [Entophlyctis luteolus]